MSDLFLGLDIGTQGAKALLVDLAAARVVARARVEYGLIEGLAEGAAEQHPQTWIEALRALAAQLFAAEPRLRSGVAGIGVSGQQHGLVVLDAEGRVLRAAKLWCDTSTAAEARALSERLGHHVPTGYTASKVVHLARTEPELFARVARVLLPHDYVNCALTGEAWMECGDASGTGFFDTRARRFDAEAMQAVHERLPGLLPPLLAADALGGALSRAGAEILGLREGIPLSVGSGDNMCSALASGASAPGTAVISLGTSATLFVQSTAPVVDPEGLIAPFCDASGAWLPLVCAMNATGVSEELRAAFGLSHAALEQAGLAAPPGARGITCLPYLVGERVPDLPEARGVWAGLRPGSFEPGLLARAGLEGVAFNLELGLERLRARTGDFQAVHLVGGAARSALWQRVLADVLGLEVRALEELETAALGAALQAAWALERSRGRGVSVHELARPFVRAAARCASDPAARAALAEARGRFRGWLARAYGVG